MSADQRRRNGRGCYYCSQGDHYARDCPKKEEDRLKRLECFACGGSGHIKRNCPYLRGDGWENSARYGTTNQHSGSRASRSSSSPASPTSPSIEIAGKEGSTGQQGSAKERKGRIMRSSSEVDPGKPASMLYYPKKKEEEEDRLKQLECFACGGSGHIKRNCPYLRGDGWENSAGYGGTNQHGGKSVSRSSSSPAVSTSPGIEIARKEGSTEQHKRVEEKKDRSSSKIDPGTPATVLYSTVTAARKLSVECSHRVEVSPPHEDQSTLKKEVLRTSKPTTLMDDDPAILSSIKDAIPPVSSYNLRQTGDSTTDTPQTSESKSTSIYPTLESNTEGCATHLESNSSLKCLDQDIKDHHDTTSVATPAVRQTSKGAKSERKRRPSHYPTFVDTHCHLEYVFERYHHRGTFDDFADRYGYPTNFDGCITTFCDPAAFSSLGSWPELLCEQNVWGSFGIHPHNAKYFHSSGLEDKLLEGLQHPKCIAFGEIGLDYSDHSPSDPQTQREILRHQLQLVVPFGKPLVLHCRDAEQDLFQILTERLPRDWPIHLHCFTGETRVAKQFMEEFPNLYLGVCGNVTNVRQTNMRAVACDVALERLLIETDAPYHVPSNLPKATGWIRNSHPALAFYVAKEIARLRKEDLSDVLKAVRTNTQTLYGV